MYLPLSNSVDIKYYLHLSEKSVSKCVSLIESQQRG